MTEQKFDALWQRAEAERYGEQMAAEYPAWRQRQRRTLAAVAAVAVMAVAAVPLFAPNQAGDNFDRVYCNRTDIANQYWAEMADALLMEA